MRKFNSVLIIPTGLGFEIGGYGGDGNVAAKLIAECSDIMITHPNVVNASDINEMTENTWYVEGNMLDRFLEGEIDLAKPLSNIILLAVNKPAPIEVINAVSAARVTLGIDIKILELETELIMKGWVENGKATGTVTGWKELVNQVSKHDFDALAIWSYVDVPEKCIDEYLHENGTNTFGAVEAILSKLVSDNIDKPVAHSPCDNTSTALLSKFDEIVDPRMGAEMSSITYLHSILKGLHKAPRIGNGLNKKDIDVMISPLCWGRPHEACISSNIPIIMVNDRGKQHEVSLPGQNAILAENYFEAAGIIMSMKAGISLQSIRRPIFPTSMLH